MRDFNNIEVPYTDACAQRSLFWEPFEGTHELLEVFIVFPDFKDGFGRFGGAIVCGGYLDVHMNKYGYVCIPACEHGRV